MPVTIDSVKQGYLAPKIDPKVKIPSEDDLCAGLDRTTRNQAVGNRPAYHSLGSRIGYGRRVVFGIQSNGLEAIFDLVEKSRVCSQLIRCLPGSLVSVA